MYICVSRWPVISVFSVGPPLSRVNILSIRIHLGSTRGQPITIQDFPIPGDPTLPPPLFLKSFKTS